ncbi:guanine nucleotide binding protein, alpha subunit [Mycena floridula]|nr:guanine nucleotide binding protein, alpha subunit [Mycena floridula]
MPVRISRRSVDEDPLAQVTAPPLDESLSEKEARISLEREAKRVSDAIDDDIDRQRVAEKRSPRAMKLLLLGQSESGKSTTLKNFQLMYEPKAFRLERASWRAIIQLNVVRSIHVILDAMTRAQYSAYDMSIDASLSSISPRDPTPDLPHIDPELLKLKNRLSPLLRIETILVRNLTPADSGETEATQFDANNYVPNLEKTKTVVREVAVNSAMAWKDVFSRLMPSGRDSFDSEEIIDWDNPNDPGRVLHECAEDMKKLWAHPTVQELLELQNLRLEEMAGFFLDCLDEVTSVRYVPTNDHILRARLKTLGVSEHRLKMNPELAGGVASDWRIFDVGGHRSLRAAWAPYFDDMDAIIFLAPISAFDQVLAEAPKVNRLEDSVLLWTTIVSNKLLRDTNLILFLNKCDILKTKLASIKLKDYVVSYGSRPNDFESASSYLRKKFAGILKENSPVPRMFYCHLTSVTNTESTKRVIANVKDMLMRENLKGSTLMM